LSAVPAGRASPNGVTRSSVQNAEAATFPVDKQMI
jgi:hypothetical protein